jgi:hypothetical protein
MSQECLVSKGAIFDCSLVEPILDCAKVNTIGQLPMLTNLEFEEAFGSDCDAILLEAEFARCIGENTSHSIDLQTLEERFLSKAEAQITVCPTSVPQESGTDSIAFSECDPAVSFCSGFCSVREATDCGEVGVGADKAVKSLSVSDGELIVTAAEEHTTINPVIGASFQDNVRLSAGENALTGDVTLTVENDSCRTMVGRADMITAMVVQMPDRSFIANKTYIAVDGGTPSVYAINSLTNNTGGRLDTLIYALRGTEITIPPKTTRTYTYSVRAEVSGEAVLVGNHTYNITSVLSTV